MTDLIAPLPLAAVIASILSPGLAYVPLKMGSDSARLQVLATGLQESGFRYRRQGGNGPARGFWQFEAGGGVKGVMNHPASTAVAHDLCSTFGVPWDQAHAWAELEANDLFACAFARLLYWTDPKPLPAIGDAPGAWNLYARTWRPGKPRPDDWTVNYAAARAALGV